MSPVKSVTYVSGCTKEEAAKKEKERLKRIDAQGSIFSRMSKIIQDFCEEEGCYEE